MPSRPDHQLECLLRAARAPQMRAICDCVPAGYLRIRSLMLASFRAHVAARPQDDIGRLFWRAVAAACVFASLIAVGGIDDVLAVAAESGDVSEWGRANAILILFSS